MVWVRGHAALPGRFRRSLMILSTGQEIHPDVPAIVRGVTTRSRTVAEFTMVTPRVVLAAARAREGARWYLPSRLL